MAAAHHHHHPAPSLTHQALPASRHSNASLINNYLLPKITGRQQQLLQGGFIVINEADVYSKPPHLLTAEHAPTHGTGRGGIPGEWYFFTRLQYTGDNQMRWSRAVGGTAAGMLERWYSDRGNRDVDGALGGYVNRLYHQEKEAEGTQQWVRTGWAMVELGYGVCDNVLCKVYYRPTRTRRAAAAADQAAGTALATEEVRLQEAAAAADQAAGTTLAGEEVLLQEAMNKLLNDDDDDDDHRIMADLKLQHGEDCDWDAVFHSYLLPVGDDGGGDTGAGDYDEAPAPRQYRRRP